MRLLFKPANRLTSNASLLTILICIRSLLKELISLEVELRRNVGEQFSVDEYRNRFPQDSLIVDDVFFTTALHDNSTPANDLFTNATLDEHAAPEKMGRYVIRPRSIKS